MSRVDAVCSEFGISREALMAAVLRRLGLHRCDRCGGRRRAEWAEDGGQRLVCLDCGRERELRAPRQAAWDAEMALLRANPEQIKRGRPPKAMQEHNEPLTDVLQRAALDGDFRMWASEEVARLMADPDTTHPRKGRPKPANVSRAHEAARREGILAMARAGSTAPTIAEALGCNVGTVYRVCSRAGVSLRDGRRAG